MTLPAGKMYGHSKDGITGDQKVETVLKDPSGGRVKMLMGKASFLAVRYIFSEMKVSFRILLSSLFVLAAALLSYSGQQELPLRQLLTYQTSSSRMVLTNSLCANFPRWSSPSSEITTFTENNRAHLNSTIPVSGTVLINKIYDKPSDAPDLLLEQAKAFGFWVGPFLLAFILTLLMWPCLACCCCCPCCCPPCCCRQKDGELYSKCEMRWPAVTLSLALMLAISSGIYGFANADHMSQSLTKLGCSFTMFADDLLNGNVTADSSSYFLGLNMLSTQLGWFSGNMTTITTQLNNFDSTNPNVSSALTSGNTLLANIKNIDGSSGSGMSAISYSAPISANSIFPSLLATFNTPGLLKDYYIGPETVVGKLKAISDNVHSFLQASSSITGGVSSLQSQLSSPINTVNSIDKKQYADIMGVYTGYATLGFQGLYAAIFGLCIIALFGTWLMCCCGKDRCRFLLYCACFFMFFLVFFTTIFTVAFSAAIPPFAWGCDFITSAFADQPQFDYNLRMLPSSMRDYVSTCMPYGSGNILSKFNINSLDTLTNLTSAFTVLSSFDIPTINTQLTNNHTTFLTIIDEYGRSRRSDLATANLAPLTQIANHNNYASCSNANFLLDSYVPSVSQVSIYVACTTPGNNAGSAACSGNYNSRAGSCYGCLDIAEIFRANSTASDVTSAVTARYTAASGCSTFAAALGNLWQNYFLVKQQVIGNSISTVVNSVFDRANSLTASINAFKSSLTTLSTAQSSVNSSLSSLDNLLDPQYGMLGGLNCKVFGQDLQRVVSTVCMDTLNSFYVLRYALGISSLAMFFALCCAVCSGSRHYRQSNCRSQKEEKSQKYAEEPQKVEETLETLRPR